MRVAFRRIAPLAMFGLLPLAVATTMFVVAIRSGPLALDFHNELYPEAKEILAGRNPYPAPDTDLTVGQNLIWPPAAAVVIAPLLLVPPAVADVAIGLAGLGCIALALWIVGLRDWRVFGVVAMWPQVIGEIRISHLTPLLCLLVALVWRYRDGAVRPGVLLGLAGAVKLFLWPLGLWLIARGQLRGSFVAAIVATGSLLLVLPFTGLDDYLRLLLDLGRTFDQDAYSPYSLLVQLDVSDLLTRSATLAIGGALLAVSWHRRSFAAAIAASLVLSPIVWLDYYAIAAIPLAIARPTLSTIWFTPMLTWGLPSSGIAAGPVWGVGRVLLVFTIVFLVAIGAEKTRSVDRASTRRRARPMGSA